MEQRLKHVSQKKDHGMISKRITRSSSISVNILEQIPGDLINKILSKLSVKSIARLRCASKDWNSILRSLDFTNLFLKVSSSRPRLLFAVVTKGKYRKLLFFSAQQPLNPDKNSSPLTTDYHMCFPLKPWRPYLLAYVYGLLCNGYIRLKREYNDSKVMISNPSTGQSIPLPIMRGQRDSAFTFLGYDPIDEQYKVLCMSVRRQYITEYEVLTLGIENPAWRMIECSLPLRFPYSPICINGVLYYLGNNGSRETLICFDVRSEEIKFIETDDKVKRPSRLMNYKGKLGVLPCDGFFNGESKSLELMVLDNVEKNEWSQHIYLFPPLWNDLVGDMALNIVGMTGNGDLVFSRYRYDDPLYIFFYNLEKNTIARVRIKGMKLHKNQRIHTFIDHVENVKLI